MLLIARSNLTLTFDQVHVAKEKVWLWPHIWENYVRIVIFLYLLILIKQGIFQKLLQNFEKSKDKKVH